MLVLFMLFCLCYHTSIGQDKLSNIRAVTNKNVHYSKPQWSPNGSKLMFTSDHNKGIYILSLKQNTLTKISDLPFVGYNATWDTTGKSIIVQEKKKSTTDNSSYYHTQRLDINSGKILATDKIAAKQIVVVTAKATIGKNATSKDIEVYINDDLQLVAIQNGITQVITKNDGQFYHPLISPDGTKVAVHNGNEIYVYSLIDINTTPVLLGEGIASSWSPDGKSIFTFMDESEDGHTISNSELYQISSNGVVKNIQITKTADTAEMWPSISPDGKKIAFSDEFSGRIFIADFKN